MDYEIIQSTNPAFNNCIVRVNIFRSHRQTIQYIQPTDAAKLGQAELVVIDEAAAIPLPYVKAMLGPYLVFMASTINGFVVAFIAFPLHFALLVIRKTLVDFGMRTYTKISDGKTLFRFLYVSLYFVRIY
jgi:tRNA(Met) C34 N-acetyltransferase TmcA